MRKINKGLAHGNAQMDNTLAIVYCAHEFYRRLLLDLSTKQLCHCDLFTTLMCKELSNRIVKIIKLKHHPVKRDIYLYMRKRNIYILFYNNFVKTFILVKSNLFLGKNRK